MNSTDQIIEPQTTSDTPALALLDLRFAYPDGRNALNGVTLAVAAGEKLALVGPNGAGKSTLLLHLNGALGQLDGSVTIAGTPVTRQALKRVRAIVGLVFQDPNDQLFSSTVFDDVAFGPLHMNFAAAEVRERVQTALEQVGMSGFGERMPHRLSLGQRKRVALATVLSMRPRLLALDEPSAGLDPRARRELVELLRALDQTLVVSTHDMRLVGEVCSRIVVLDEGRVVWDGPAGVALNDAALLERHGLEG